MLARPVDAHGWGRLLGGALVALLPVFFVGGFHEPFTTSKLIPLFALGVPAALLLTPNRRGHDPLDRWRRAAMVLAPTWLLAAWVRGPAEPYPMILIAGGWIFLSIGAAYGDTPERARRLVTILGAAAIPVLIVGVLRRYAGWFTFIPDRDDVALAATIGNSNELAEYAAPVGVLCLMLPAMGRRWGWALFAACAALVALSESRGGMLGLGLGCAVVGLWLVRGNQTITARRTGAAVLVVIVAAGALLATLASDRVASVLDFEHPTNVVRIGLWEAGLEIGRNEPVLGCGAGRFEATAPPFRRAVEWEISGFETRPESPHNEIVWLFATGGLLGLVTLAAAGSLIARSGIDAGKSDDESTRPITVACIGALATFGVIALMRSPLHHPCGFMAAALAAGVLSSLSGRGLRERRMVPPAMWVSWLLVLGGAWVALNGVAEDALVYRARQSKVEANEALKAGNVREAVGHFRTMTNTLNRLANDPPSTIERCYRSSLVGFEVAEIRNSLMAMTNALEQAGLGSPLEWLPSQETVDALIDLTLKRAPHYPRALMQRARSAMGHGDIGTAAAALDDAGWLDQPWPHRLQLKGALSLRLGTDSATFGAWLDAPEGGDIPKTHIDAAHAAFAAEDFNLARVEAVRHLGLDPRDLGALKILTDIGTKISPPPDFANHAVARSRLLLALEAQEAGNARMLEIHLRIARSKDPTLLDAHYLAARVAALASDETALRDALQALRDHGLPQAAITARAAGDDAFTPFRGLLR